MVDGSVGEAGARAVGVKNGLLRLEHVVLGERGGERLALREQGEELRLILHAQMVLARREARAEMVSLRLELVITPAVHRV